MRLDNASSRSSKTTHWCSTLKDDSLAKSGDYYWSDSNVKRSLYMDDFLYTISDRMVKANGLSDLNEISSVVISEETNAPYGIIE